LTQPSDRAVIFGLMVPTMAVVLNLTMFGVALPAVRDGFQIQTDVAALVVVAYTLPFMLATMNWVSGTSF
jgi:hypothetical protein